MFSKQVRKDREFCESLSLIKRMNNGEVSDYIFDHFYAGRGNTINGKKRSWRWFFIQSYAFRAAYVKRVQAGNSGNFIFSKVQGN